MAVKTRITDMLGIEKPIIQAAMGWIARSKLSSAVSNAGGLGIIETSSGELDAIKVEIVKMRELTDKPFGVNVAQAFVRDPGIVQFVIDQGVRFVTTSAGDPMKYTAMLKAAGLTVFHVVPNLPGALRAVQAGVDGLIVVDVPPEADNELCLPALERGLSFIRLATPTTDDARLPAVLANTSGFVYYVSITGITGAAAPVVSDVAAQVARIKRSTALPVVVGFGVRTPEQARVIAACADGVVVGSALVEAIRMTLGPDGQAGADTVAAVHKVVRDLATALRGTSARV